MLPFNLNVKMNISILCNKVFTFSIYVSMPETAHLTSASSCHFCQKELSIKARPPLDWVTVTINYSARSIILNLAEFGNMSRNSKLNWKIIQKKEVNLGRKICQLVPETLIANILNIWYWKNLEQTATYKPKTKFYILLSTAFT